MATKKLSHFILPDHFNKLYTEEAISSISLTRDIADKINELIDLVNKFDDEDLTWKHEMEGTIRKAVIYMKDNLLNSLHDLLELYVENGIIDEKIEHELNKTNIKIDMLHVTPQMYGALGDGKNDDSKLVRCLCIFVHIYAKGQAAKSALEHKEGEECFQHSVCREERNKERKRTCQIIRVNSQEFTAKCTCK